MAVEAASEVEVRCAGGARRQKVGARWVQGEQEIGVRHRVGGQGGRAAGRRKHRLAQVSSRRGIPGWNKWVQHALGKHK